MILVLGSLQLGLIYGLLAMGVFITFRILCVPDLTAEGSFTFGLASSAALTAMDHPVLGIFVGIVSGVFAGSITGFLQTKCRIHPVLAGILTMSGLYSINLCMMGASSNLTLINHITIFKGFQQIILLDKEISRLLLALIVVGVTAAFLILFFRMHLGLCIRATGDNEDMVRASSIDVDRVKIIALALSNGCIALSGALIAQYQGFADINSGVGILVVGLASVIIGELFVRRMTVTTGLLISILGSIIYRFVIAIATATSFLPAYSLKLVSAMIVGIAFSFPVMKEFLSDIQERRKQVENYKIQMKIRQKEE